MLPSPIFETGATPTNAKANINIGKTAVDMAMDFQNQPDQWCQAFQFAYTHLLSTKQHPTPLELVEVLLFISTDRAKDTLRKACIHAIKCLEGKEFKHFNKMLPILDETVVTDYAKDSQRFQADLKKDNVSEEIQTKVQWILHLHRKSLSHKTYFHGHNVEAKTNKPNMLRPFVTRKPSGSHLFEVEAGEILESNPIAHLRSHHYGFLYYKQSLVVVLNLYKD